MAKHEREGLTSAGPLAAIGCDHSITLDAYLAPRFQPGTYGAVMREIEQRVLAGVDLAAEDDAKVKRRLGRSLAAWKALADHLSAAGREPVVQEDDQVLITNAAFRAIVLAIASTGVGLNVIEEIYSVLASHMKTSTRGDAESKKGEARANADAEFRKRQVKTGDDNWSRFARWYADHLAKQGIYVSAETIRSHWKPDYLKK